MNDYSFNNHLYNNTRCSVQRHGQGRVENDIMPTAEMMNGTECKKPCKKEHFSCDHCELKCKNEHGGEVFFANVSKLAAMNDNFRQSIWTGEYLQSTVMSLPCRRDIGVEVHTDTDQFITVAKGFALVTCGNSEYCLSQSYKLCAGESVFIPAGVWHNVTNIGRCALKLVSVYAPPHHPRCTVEENKK